MGKLYDESSIESLSPLEFTRLRPQVYVGNTEYSTQLLIEIVSNSIDEYRLGHGDRIDIKIEDNGTITVEDHGQGFLINSVREDGKTVLEAAFSVLNTSGKYRSDGVYEGTSLGTYGIGSKLATFLSHWLVVTSIRDGQYETIRFKEGEFAERQVGRDDSPSGTTVSWLPSEEFFTNIGIEEADFRKLCKTLCCLCPGLTIALDIRDTQEIFQSKNGISDLVDEAVKDKEIIGNRFVIDYSEGKYKIDLVMTYTSNYTSSIVPYVNTGLTTQGPHITQIKTLFTREFNKFFREKGWLKEKDDNLTGDDIQEGMYLVFNITAPDVAYDAQVKTRLTKIEMKPFTQAIATELQYWLQLNEKDIKKLADKALGARKAREAARKARDAARDNGKKKESGLKAKMQLSSKFIDCTSKNIANRNLLVVEGLSAGASAIEARNPKTDCIYMLRGKIISPLKSTVDKILANQEMSDIIKVIGAGFQESFNIDKMNFNKIVITTDADSDGDDIALMLITFFFTYMRPLVEAGKLYRAVTPLYIIRQRDKEYYCYSDGELDEWKSSHTGSYDLLRAKG